MEKLKSPEEFISEYMVPSHKDDVLFERSMVIELMEKYAELINSLKK
jgi:hypothetical protein